MDKFLIKFISFFSYIGFYVGLSFLLAFNLGEFTRYYSIPIRLLLAVLMIVFLIYYARKNTEIKSDSLIYGFWIIYILKAYFDIANPDTNYSKDPVEFIFYTLMYCVLPFIMFKNVDLDRYNNIILNSLIFAGFVLGVVSIFLYKDIILSGSIGRINQAKYLGFEINTINPLILSYTSSLTLSLVIYKFVSGENRKTYYVLYLAFTVVISLILLLLGSSRGSIISLLFSLMILFYYGDLRFKKSVLIVLVLVSPLAIWGIVKIGSSILDRMSTVSNLESDNSASTRMEYWEDSFNELFNNPFIGGRLEVSGIYPHNIFVEILMSTGLIGFTLFLFFIIFCLFRVSKASKYNQKFIWLYMFFIQALIHYNFTESIYLANALFISSGLICSKSLNLKK